MLRVHWELMQATAMRLNPKLLDPNISQSPTPNNTLSDDEIAVIRECLKDKAFADFARQICALLNE